MDNNWIYYSNTNLEVKYAITTIFKLFNIYLGNNVIYFCMKCDLDMLMWDWLCN